METAGYALGERNTTQPGTESPACAYVLVIPNIEGRFQRAMRHTSPETKRHYQLGMADQVRQAVDKAKSGCTESGHRYISVTVRLKKKRR